MNIFILVFGSFAQYVNQNGDFPLHELYFVVVVDVVFFYNENMEPDSFLLNSTYPYVFLQPKLFVRFT